MKHNQQSLRKYVMLTALIVLMLFATACAQGETTDDASMQNEPNETTQGETGKNEEASNLDTFKIGVIPALTEGDYEVPMTKLEALLDEALPYDVEINVYPDYNGVVEALNFDHIQMAYLGPSTFIIANERSGAQAIVTQLIDGKPYYHSYIITHVDAPWETLDDLLADVEDVTFAFGDINSTSGSLVPSVELKERGVYTDENTHSFKNVTFTGSHDATGMSVQNKHVDAGAIDSAYFDTLVNQGKLDGNQLKVIWESKPLFQYPWAVSAKVDEDTIKLIQDTFVSIDDEDILRGFGATGFTIATNDDYEEIRKIMIETGKLEK